MPELCLGLLHGFWACFLGCLSHQWALGLWLVVLGRFGVLGWFMGRWVGSATLQLKQALPEESTDKWLQIGVSTSLTSKSKCLTIEVV